MEKKKKRNRRAEKAYRKSPFLNYKFALAQIKPIRHKNIGLWLDDSHRHRGSEGERASSRPSE